MSWKNEIKKMLNVDRSVLEGLEDDLGDVIHAISITPECIKNAESESKKHKENITPDMVAIEAIGIAIKSMIQDKIESVGEGRELERWNV
jgi:hypothetical protein